MAKILNGKRISERILGNLKKEIKRKRLRLALGIVSVGESKVSKIYINQKRKACEFVDVNFRLFRFPLRISTKNLEKEVKEIIPRVSGLIIQLPLPSHIKSQDILNVIPLKKDIDCLSDESLGNFYTANLSILPPTVSGVSRILKEYKIKIKGKNVVVIGSGRLTGKPLALWFIQNRATVTILDKFAKNTSFFTQKADILVSGVGKPNLITGKIIKRGAIVIDVGTSFRRGRLVGDADFKSCSRKASYITPVPGGVGPLTVACLIKNLVKINL